MPIIRVEMVPGRSIEQKRELAAVFTREMVRVTGCSEGGVTVIFEETSKQNWAVGGQLFSDRYPD